MNIAQRRDREEADEDRDGKRRHWGAIILLLSYDAGKRYCCRLRFRIPWNTRRVGAGYAPQLPPSISSGQPAVAGPPLG
jgi:hypothetical protein